jgi:hypothetical protein
VTAWELPLPEEIAGDELLDEELPEVDEPDELPEVLPDDVMPVELAVEVVLAEWARAATPTAPAREAATSPAVRLAARRRPRSRVFIESSSVSWETESVGWCWWKVSRWPLRHLSPVA